MLVVLETKPILISNWVEAFAHTPSPSRAWCHRVQMTSAGKCSEKCCTTFHFLSLNFVRFSELFFPEFPVVGMTTLRALSAVGRFVHLHRRSLLSNFSLSRHDRLANFSDALQRHRTNTRVRSPNSVFISTPVTAHSRKLVCWIDSEYFRRFSSVQFGKCSGTDKSLSEKLLSVRSVSLKASRMVWITDLDNPKVNWSGKFWRDDLDTGWNDVVCPFRGWISIGSAGFWNPLRNAVATRLLINIGGKMRCLPLDKDTTHCFCISEGETRENFSDQLISCWQMKFFSSTIMQWLARLLAQVFE